MSKQTPGAVAAPTTTGGDSSTGADDAASLSFVLKVLRRWWLIATPVGLLLAAAGGVAMWLTFVPQYQAVAWFRIEERTPYLAFESKSTEEMRSKPFFQTQIELIRSPLVLGPVLDRPDIAGMLGIQQKAGAIASLAKRVNVALVGQSELFNITYAAASPKNAAAIVNAITQSYFALRERSDSERARRIIDKLEEEKTRRLKDVLRLREELRDLSKRVTGSDFSSTPEVESSAKNALAGLQGRMIAAQVDRAVIEARIQAGQEQSQGGRGDRSAKASEANSSGATPAPTSTEEIAWRNAIVDQAITGTVEVQSMEAAIAAKQTQLQQLESVLAKGNHDPRCVGLAAQILRDRRALDERKNQLRPAMEKEVAIMLAAKRTETEHERAEKQNEELSRMYVEAKSQQVLEDRLKAEYEKELKSVKQVSGDTLELDFKRDELARAEKVVELIADRSLQLQTERGAPARVALLRMAEIPTEPIEWFPYRNVLVSVLAGLCLPFALAFGWERLIRRVSDPAELECRSPMMVVGEIASLPTRGPLPAMPALAQLGLRGRLLEESVDRLRTSLTLSDDLRNMRLLAVTSATSGEGKTSVAAQLAASLARATRESILLIDGDMRSPDLHRLFEVPLEPGLTKVLARESSLEEAIVTTWSERVHLLPAGRLTANPHSLLGDGAWEAMLAQIPAAYRYVIIDTPPVLAASESLLLAKAADAALICAMRDFSRVDQVRMVYDQLIRVGGCPAGIVLNGVPTRYYARRYGSHA